MPIDLAVIKAWLVVSALISVVGFLFGYTFISDRLDGAVFGLIIVKILEFIYLKALLGLIAAVI